MPEPVTLPLDEGCGDVTEVVVPVDSDIARYVAELRAAGTRFTLEISRSLECLFLTLPDAEVPFPGWSAVGVYGYPAGDCRSAPDDWSVARRVFGLEQQ